MQYPQEKEVKKYKKSFDMQNGVVLGL